MVALCVDAGGNVLAVSRKGNPEDLGLVGGKIDYGDPSPVEALCREFYEEVGVRVMPNELCFVYERVDPVSGHVAWCYQLMSGQTRGHPRAVEPGTWVGWVTPERLLDERCLFREYNLGLFKAVGLIPAE